MRDRKKRKNEYVGMSGKVRSARTEAAATADQEEPLALKHRSRSKATLMRNES
jgi:hypothetical protein